MENKIREILAAIMEVSINDIDEDSSKDTISNWDSLKHMNLIVAIEEEFSIEFDEEELIELTDFKALVRGVLDKV